MIGMMRMMRKGLPFWLSVGVLGAAVAAYLALPRDTYEVFDGLEGPEGVSWLPAEAPTEAREAWKKEGQGKASRLAVLLTDPGSAWVGVQQAL